jgi:hypothetical protein
MSDFTVAFAGATATGITALTLQTLGVEPQALVYGAVGAGIGTTAAPALGRVRAVMMFVCVVCLCAVAGTVIAGLYWGNSNIWRNLIAGCLAAIFHPLFSAIVVKIPEALDGILRKVGLKQND